MSDNEPVMSSMFNGGTMSFTLGDVDPDAMALLYGGHVGATIPEPTHSIYMTTTEEVSGEPERPKHVRGFWAWLRGVNHKNQDAYVRARLRWIAAGKPTKTVERGFYIPKARLNIVNPA